MAKLAKVIDVEGVQGLDQILIYVNKPNDIYECHIDAHIDHYGYISMYFKGAPYIDDDYERSVKAFKHLSTKEEAKIIEMITSRSFYKDNLENECSQQHEAKHD